MKVFLAFGSVLLLVALLTGCSGSHAEYAPKTHPLIGSTVSFKMPMAYLTNLPKGYSDREVMRIGRRTATLERALEDKQYIAAMKDAVVTPIPAGTEWEVIAVFTVVHDGLSRAFAHDFDVVVLRDARGNVSTMLLSDFQDLQKESETQ